MSGLWVVITHDTFREIFDQAPVGMAYVSLEGKWLEVNARLCEITGYSREELLATCWQKITHPDDLVSGTDVAARIASGDLDHHTFEKRYIRKDGRTIWVKKHVSLMQDGTAENRQYYITIVDDITEYKRARELQLKAEEKVAKAFRQTPMAIMLVRLKDNRFLEVNEAFERFTGYSREETIGKTPFDLNVWVDPARRQEVVDTIQAGKRVEARENLFRRKDGTICTGLTYTEQIDIDGEPCLLAAALDISDRKRLESELQELSGRLIKAQDEERKALASELSDSLGQSVTAISLEACQLARSAEGDLGRKLQSLCADIQGVVAGIGMLAQSLHPAGLDYTGLPWAIEGLCRQFRHFYGLQVSLKHDNIPSSLSPDVAIALYRVLQEALRNVVQHSGTRQAWIELASDGQNIRLDFWDRGVGFDIASTRAGLGLLTMRERCRRLNGFLLVRNHKGTRIEVEIPIAHAEGNVSEPAAQDALGDREAI